MHNAKHKNHLPNDYNTLAQPRWNALRNADFYNIHYLQEVQDMPHTRTITECNGIEKLLTLKPTHSIIDLCSGEGRLALELSRRGYSILGIDNNITSVELAQHQAEASCLATRFIYDDARQCAKYKPCDRIYCSSASLNGFTWPDVKIVIQNLNTLLAPGGRLLLEVANRERLVRDFHARTWKQIGDQFVTLIERSFDHSSNEYIEIRTRYFPNGDREKSQINITIYPQDALRQLLQENGFNIVATYGEYTGTPLTDLSTYLIFIVEHKKTEPTPDQKGGDYQCNRS